MTLTASQAVDHLLQLAGGRPGTFLAGSLIGGLMYDKPYTDADIFCASPVAASAGVQLMLDNGGVLDEKAARTWDNWQQGGMDGWHTNSITVELLNGLEVNLIYKTIGNHPLDTIEKVLGSFDFGYVAAGYDLELRTFHDGREFWFGKGVDLNRLGMLPQRRKMWLKAKVGRYTGVRQAQRFAKFGLRGYDMSLVAPVLVQGYRTTAAHYLTKDDPEYAQYAPLYLAFAQLIELEDLQGIEDAFKVMQPHDPVASMMGVLP